MSAGEIGEVAAVVAIVVSVMVLLLVIPAVVLQIIGMCKVFKKAGKPVGFFFIPVYSYYVQCEIAGCKNLFWGYLPALIVSWIVTSITPSSESGLLVIALLSMACAIAMLVFNIIFSVKLAKAFGKSGGFAVGLIFLPFVFYMILGCGKDPYLGKGAPAPQQEAAPGSAWKCASCGAFNLPDNRFCFHCGKEKDQ